jgi:hypothetical protein
MGPPVIRYTARREVLKPTYDDGEENIFADDIVSRDPLSAQEEAINMAQL